MAQHRKLALQLILTDPQDPGGFLLGHLPLSFDQVIELLLPGGEGEATRQVLEAPAVCTAQGSQVRKGLRASR